MASTQILSSKSSTTSGDNPTSTNSLHATFFDKTPERAAARAIYLKNFLGGTVLTIVLIFSVFVIFWNAFANSPAHNLPGWIVDFDGSLLGQEIIQGLKFQPSFSKITWTVVSATQFPSGIEDLGHAVMEEHTWVAVAINKGSTARLSASLTSPNASYNGADAITVFVVEARNEMAFTGLIIPSVLPALDAITKSIALQNGQRLSNSSLLSSILSISPQTIVQPVSYTLANLAPFNVPLASAVTYIGLIYQIIISFFMVVVGFNARMASGLEKSLSTSSLIAVRFVSVFGSFFAVSLFYSLLSVAFQLELTNRFGHAGFIIFWMLNFCGMLAVGLALESVIPLLTTKFIPFFLLTWIIINISVCVFPIEVMPNFYRYGYAVPFYSISRAMRTIIFGTKNAVGLSFGIILAWTAISCITLPLIQWYVRRRSHRSQAGLENQVLPTET
ncbi:hypothetical protein BYT27DRAFT_7145655 [Phlegmacium glaucopus]|nr:hypothetical protein BYT27DRAFT_7145655 [Phlegmacium glaucopus]